MNLLKSVSKLLPMVSPPLYKQTFNSRLRWTGIILILYLVMSYVPVFGVRPTEQAQYLLTIQYLLGSRFGSLMTLGIGPIVTAGIIMQLLVGSKIIDWDLTKDEDRKKFQTWNKFLAVVFCFFEAVTFVLLGTVPSASSLIVFVILQLAVGGILVILMDEVVTKWGFGSGISLFIVAGIATQIMVRVLSPFPIGCSFGNLPACIPSVTSPPVGSLWQFLISLFTNDLQNALFALIPILSTVFVFFLVVYTQNIRVEIPLSFSMLKGFGRVWDLKFFYTSNIPVILMAALFAYIQVMGRAGVRETDGMQCGLLGCYDSRGNPVSGLVYFLSSPHNLLVDGIRGTLTGRELLRALTYFLAMCLGAMVFSLFWVTTSGMDAKSVAEQIDSIGMQIPGYRKDVRVMESVLNKYIPGLTVLGGLAVGALAALADFTGAIGTGTGILLTVMIIYNYYEIFSRERLEEAPKLVRKIFGE